MAATPLMDDDCSLLSRTKDGDEQAMVLLYDRHSSIAYSTAMRVLRDASLAEQVLTDIFLDIWRDPASFAPIGLSAAPSIAMLARNRAVATLENKPAPALDFGIRSASSSFIGLNITRDQACQVIDKMPSERRALVEAMFFSGVTLAAPAGAATETGRVENPLLVSEAVSRLADTGLEVIDIASDPAFARRRLHDRDAVTHIDGMNRLACAFVQSPAGILQELVNAAVDLCGADSAGISIEQKNGPEDHFYHWVATAGQYSGFTDAKLPRYPSACGVTLERNTPQLFRVGQRFFDRMGIQAPTVTDGLLLPWQVDDTRGTIWIMAHGREETFDSEDCRMMQELANFAATGVRLQKQQKLLVQQAAATAEAHLANRLAHQINNPLQGLMQTVYLFGREDSEPRVFAQQAMGEVSRLSDLVQRLLSSPESS